MKRRAVYQAWSREGDRWRPWVKPVLFAALDEEVTATRLREPPAWLGPRLVDPLAARPATRREEAPYRESGRMHDTAIVIDLPGAISAELGVALARHGFRPVPLYNAVPAPEGVAGVVDMRPIMSVLVDAASVVGTLPDGLPPAFLLDADRLGRPRDVRGGVFDNRSVCRSSDFPSADTMLASGIRRVVLVGANRAADLEAIMLEWQSRGIEVWSIDGSGNRDVHPIVLEPRPWFMRLADFLRQTVLRRRSDGSYGMTVPQGG